MKHRHASGLLLGAIVIAGASLSDAPDALSQIVTPACEQTATPPALSDDALDAATPIKFNVTFDGTALVSGATCGTVFAREVDLASVALDSTDMNITAVRLVATFTGDVRFYATSADADEYVRAYDCDDVGGPDTDLCVRFPDAAGRSLRWKAVMCNSATISSVQTIFDYNADNEHYHGGIAVHENVSYFGGFGQPDDLGQMYAISTDFGTDHWNGRDRLQVDGDRRIFTTGFDGTQRLTFDLASATLLMDVLGVPSVAEAGEVISWVRTQARFGPDTLTPLERRRFGGVITSTPTVVAKPDLPVWFSRADDPVQRREFQEFQEANGDRPPMVIYGAKDGMVHALFSDPGSITNPEMGTEAWAYIPASVASRLYSDYQESLSRGRTFIRAYPDTWPVVEDVWLQVTEEYATIAVLNEGKGGSSISVLDITQTATGDAANGYLPTGPTPLWYKTPGDGDAGQSSNRPAIARVEIDGGDRYMVIAGTGIAFDDPDSEKGRTVVAYDAETGTPFWQFQTRCPLTTSITVFETDDEGEPAPQDGQSPLTLDGYMDRAVFADRCGFIYKIDLTRETDGGLAEGIGGILDASTQIRALFQTAGGLPVTGNIGARALLDEDTTRVSLFFGTGGLEDAPPFPQNTFYVIAAAPDNVTDTNPANLILDATIKGACAEPSRCEKFYGGVRLNPEQVIFTRVLEPVIGNATCDPGQTTIEVREITGDVSSPNFLQESFTTTVDGMITSPLTARGNAIYFTDSRGRVNSVGDTQAPNTGFGPDEGRGADTNAPMLLLGWRQVY